MSNLLDVASRFLKRNGSTILTCIGAAGVVGTAVLAVKATPKATKLLDKAKEEKGEDLTTIETIKIAGPAYIPAVAVGASTIACIFGANVLNKHQQGMLVSAYALLENSYKEYKAKLTELYGEDADERIKGGIASDKYEEYDVQPVDNEKELFFDFYSMRYFESTMEKVLEAEDEFNELLSCRGWVSINEFYDLIGLDHIGHGHSVGWSTDEYYQVDFNHDTVKVGVDDNLECCVVSFAVEPNIF